MAPPTAPSRSAVLLPLSDHRIALVDKTNTGAADTRNQGLALAHGRYVQFVDSDDWLAPGFYRKAGHRRRDPHRRSCDRALLDGVSGKTTWSTSARGKRRCSTVLQRNPPRTRAYGYLPAGVYTGQEYARQLIQKPNTFYYGSPWNKLYRRDLLAGHGIPFPAKNCLRRISCSTPNICAMCAPPFPSRTSATYYLQNSQSVSHSRVTTADILRLRRRVMGLYKSIYTELGIYPETRAAILRSALWRK